MNKSENINQLMDEEEKLINDRKFFLSMMEWCDNVIQTAEKSGHPIVVDQFKREKADYHQKWKDANYRLKQIEREIYELS